MPGNFGPDSWIGDCHWLLLGASTTDNGHMDTTSFYIIQHINILEKLTAFSITFFIACRQVISENVMFASNGA